MANPPSQFDILANLSAQAAQQPTAADVQDLHSGYSPRVQAMEEARRGILEAKRELDPSYQGDTFEDFLLLNPEASEEDAANYMAQREYAAEAAEQNFQQYSDTVRTAYRDRTVGEHVQDAWGATAQAVNETGAAAVGLIDIVDNTLGTHQNVMRELGAHLGRNLGLVESTEDSPENIVEAFTGAIEQSSDGLFDFTEAYRFFHEGSEYWRKQQSEPMQARKQITNEELAVRAEQRRVAADAYVAQGGNSTVADMERLMGDFTDALATYGTDPVLLVDAFLEEALTLVAGGGVAKLGIQGGLKATGRRSIEQRVLDASERLRSEAGTRRVRERAEEILTAHLTPSGHTKPGSKNVTNSAIQRARAEIQKEVHKEVGLDRINQIAAAMGATHEAVTEGVLSAADVRIQILDSTPEELMESSPAYKAYIESGMSHLQAKERLALTAFNYTFWVASALAGGTSKVTGMANLQGSLFLPETRLGNLANRAKTVASNAMIGAVSEGISEGGAQLAANQGYAWALDLLDKDRDALAGVGTGAGIGAAIGGGIGVGAGLLNPGTAKKNLNDVSRSDNAVVFSAAQARKRREMNTAELDSALNDEVSVFENEEPTYEPAPETSAEQDAPGEATVTDTETVVEEVETETVAQTAPVKTRFSQHRSNLREAAESGKPIEGATLDAVLDDALSAVEASTLSAEDVETITGTTQQLIHAVISNGLGEGVDKKAVQAKVQELTRKTAELKPVDDSGVLGSSREYNPKEVDARLEQQANNPAITGSPERRALLERQQTAAASLKASKGVSEGSAKRLLETPTPQGVTAHIKTLRGLKELVSSVTDNETTALSLMRDEAQIRGLGEYDLTLPEERAKLIEQIDRDINALGAVGYQLIELTEAQDKERGKQEALREAKEAREKENEKDVVKDETSATGVAEDTGERDLTPREQLTRLAEEILPNVSSEGDAVPNVIAKINQALERDPNEQQLQNLLTNVRSRLTKLGVNVNIPTKGAEKRTGGRPEPMSAERYDEIHLLLIQQRSDEVDPADIAAYTLESTRRQNLNRKLNISTIQRDGDGGIIGKELEGQTVVFLDLDSLKYFNDTFSYEAGDKALSFLVNALADAGIDRSDIFHIHGDEFAVRGGDPENLLRQLRTAQNSLLDVEIAAPEGSGKTDQKGIGFSFGVSTSGLHDAEMKAKVDKEEREKLGLRAGRAAVPPNPLRDVPGAVQDVNAGLAPISAEKFSEIVPDTSVDLDDLIASIDNNEDFEEVDGGPDNGSESLRAPQALLDESPVLADSADSPNTLAKIVERSLASKLLQRLIKVSKKAGLPATMAGALIDADRSLEARAKRYARKELQKSGEKEERDAKLAILKQALKTRRLRLTTREDLLDKIDDVKSAYTDRFEALMVEYTLTDEAQYYEAYSDVVGSFKDKLTARKAFRIDKRRRAQFSMSGKGDDKVMNFERDGDFFLSFFTVNNTMIELPTLVQNALTAGGLSFLIESGPLSLNDPNTARALADKNGNEDLTQEEQEYQRLGSPIQSVAPALGRQVLRQMGIQYNTEALNEIDRRRLEYSAGVYALESLQRAGMVRVQTHKTKDLRMGKAEDKPAAVTEFATFDGKGNAEITTVQAVTQGSEVTTVDGRLSSRPKLDSDVERIRAMHAEHPDRNLLGKSKNKVPTSDPTEVGETHGGDRFRKLSAARKKANEVMNNDKQVPATEFLTWMGRLFPTLSEPHPDQFTERKEDKGLNRLFGIDYTLSSFRNSGGDYETVYAQQLAEMELLGLEGEEAELAAREATTAIVGDPGDQTKAPRSVARRVKGQIVDRLREVRAVRWLANKAKEGDSFYLSHLYKSTRMFVQETGVSPQDSHPVRHFMQSESMVLDYDMNDRDDMDMFYAALAENLDLAPEKNIPSNWRQYVEAEFERVTKNGVEGNEAKKALAEAIYNLHADNDKQLTGPEGQQQLIELIEAAYPEDHIKFSLRKRFRALGALTELAKLRVAKDRGESTFKSHLRIEADATNSGVALAFMQFGIGVATKNAPLTATQRENIEELAAAVGMYLDTSKYATHGDFLNSKGGEDLYERLSSRWAHYAKETVRVLKEGTPSEQSDFFNDINNLLIASGASQTAIREAREDLARLASMPQRLRESASTLLRLSGGDKGFAENDLVFGIVNELKRNIAKGPLMTTAYSAGLKSVITNVTREALEAALAHAARNPSMDTEALQTLNKAFQEITGEVLNSDTALTNTMIETASKKMLAIYGTPLSISTAEILGPTVKVRNALNGVLDAQNRIYVQQQRKYLKARGYKHVDEMPMAEKQAMEDALVRYMPRVPAPDSGSRDEWVNLLKKVPDRKLNSTFAHELQDSVPEGYKRPTTKITLASGKTITVELPMESVDNLGVRAAVNAIQNMDSAGQTFVINYLNDNYGINLQNQHDASIVAAKHRDQLLEAYAAFMASLQDFDLLGEVAKDFHAMFNSLTAAEQAEVIETFKFTKEDGEKVDNVVTVERILREFQGNRVPDLAGLAVNNGGEGDLQVVQLKNENIKSTSHYGVLTMTTPMPGVKSKRKGNILGMLASSADSEFIDTEDEDVTDATYLDAQGVVDTFDRLGREDNTDVKITPVHSTRLRRVISAIAEQIVDPALSVVYHERRKGDRNFGNFQHRGDSGKVVVNLAKQAGYKFGMSAQEVYTHEMLHHGLHAAFRRGGKHISDLMNLFAEAKTAFDDGAITVEDFLDPQWKDSTQTITRDADGKVVLDSEYAHAYKVAEDRANHIFNNDGVYTKKKVVGVDGKEHEYTIPEGLAEFAVLTVTNPAVAGAMGKVTPPKTHLEKAAARQDGFVGKILLWWDGLLDSLSRWFTNPDATDDPDFVHAVDMLVTDMLKTQTQTKTKEHVMDKADDTVRQYAREYIWDRAVKWAHTKINDEDALKRISKGSAGRLESSLFTLAALVHKASENSKNKTVNDQIHDLINYLYRNTDDAHKRFVYRVLKELSGFSQRFRKMEALNRLTNKVVDQTRQNITRVREQQLVDAFSRALTPAELQDLTALLSSDASLLLGGTPVAGGETIDWGEMQNLLTQPSARRALITQLENRLVALTDARHGAVMSEYATGLAKFQLTGDVTLEHQPRNAYAIARQFYLDPMARMDLKAVQINELERIVDQLASVQALHESLKDTDRRERMANLVSKEGKGLKFFLETSKAVSKAGKEQLFIEAPWNYVKGRVKEVYPYGFTYVHTDNLDKETVRSLKSKGYDLVSEDPIERDTDYGKEPKYVWVNRVAGPQSWQSGAMTLGEPEHEGVSLIATVTSGKVDAAARAAAKTKLHNLRNRKRQRVAASFKQGHAPKAASNRTLMPVFNDTGMVIDYIEVMNASEKDELLQRGHNALQILAHTEGSNASRLAAEEQNQKVVDTLVDDFNDKEKNVKYVFVGPDVEDRSIRDIWYRVPRNYRKKLEAGFKGKTPDGKKGFMVHPEIFALTFGQAGLSVNKWGEFDNPEQVSALKKLVFETLRPIFGSKGAVYTERVLEDLVSIAKDTIVVKSLSVLFHNILGNVSALAILGIPPWKSIPMMMEAQSHIGEYREHLNERIRLEGKLAIETDAGERRKMQSKINTLNQQLNSNPIADLIDQGLLTTLAEDIETSVGDISTNFIERKLEPLAAMLPEGVKNVGSQLLLGHDTAAYKWLSNQTQTSDLQARYALHQHNLAKGMDFQESIQLVQDMFGNYLRPSHPVIEKLNKGGFTPFSRFPSFMVRPAAYVIRTRPVSTFAAQAFFQLTGINIGTLVSDNMVVSGVNVTNPVDFIPAMYAEHATVKGVEGVVEYVF